ncbi:SnoaL-like protein [Halopolyspora algeriensis]|uniref:SnoaL-like protein n=1 Tax=Halopolyspora algeriensis TaxID=1500506 RepID=A0A368VTR3_9ACTN|nr:nuclear transport factor 2 family protein [Halopolyspora algeriensis]RCW44586.1 SnoaL-like protein [Halopolyspora algeriensis]TQM55946.1 SnoaL-like protein [Halopolyspora algeriensis]
MDLHALEEIRRVKYRYLRSIDLKRWDELAGTLTEEATADYGTPVRGEPLRLAGRDAIVEFMRQNLGPDIITVHSCSQPEIDIDGDTAAGTWCFDDTVIVHRHRLMIRGSAYYEDRYRREADGAWRIEHTGYVRLYEATLSLDDVPSFRLTANRWADAVAG